MNMPLTPLVRVLKRREGRFKRSLRSNVHDAFDQLMLYFEATASFGIATYFLSHNTHRVSFHYSLRRIVMKVVQSETWTHAAIC